MQKHTFKAVIENIAVDCTNPEWPRIVKKGPTVVIRTSTHEYHFFWEIVQVIHWLRFDKSSRQWVPMPAYTELHHDCGFRTLPGPGKPGHIHQVSGHLMKGSAHVWRKDTITLFLQNVPVEIIK